MHILRSGQNFFQSNSQLHVGDITFKSLTETELVVSKLQLTENAVTISLYRYKSSVMSLACSSTTS